MAFLKKTNNARSSINMGGGFASGVTTLTVTSGSVFPATGDFLITIWNSITYQRPGLDGNMEICRCTARSGNNLTVIRAQEGTNDNNHVDGETVDMLITAGLFDESFDQNLKQTDPVTFGSLLVNGGVNVEITDAPEIVSLRTVGINSSVTKANDLFTGAPSEIVVNVGMEMSTDVAGSIANYGTSCWDIALAHSFNQRSEHSYSGTHDLFSAKGGVYGGIGNNDDINAAGKILNTLNLGFYSDCQFAGSSTAGTHNVDNVLITGILQTDENTVTTGTIRNIGLYVYNNHPFLVPDSFFQVSGGEENYVILNESVYPIAMRADNSSITFGAGDDASIYYNGGDLIINPKVVGTGLVNIPGDIQINSIYLGNNSSSTQTLFEILDSSGASDRPRFQWRPDYESIFALTGNKYGGFSFYAPSVVYPDSTGLINFSGGNSDLVAASLDPNADETIVLYDNSTGNLLDSKSWQIAKLGSAAGSSKNCFQLKYLELGSSINRNVLQILTTGEAEFYYNTKINTDTNTNIKTEIMTVDLSGLHSGLVLTIPILNSTAYSTHPEILPFPYGLGVYDTLGIFDKSVSGSVQILFAGYELGVASASLTADLTDQLFKFNWAVCPETDNNYDLGTSALEWKNLYLSGDAYADEIILPKTAGKGIKVDPAAPTFGWRDIVGQIIPHPTGSAAPAFTAYHTGNTLSYAFNTNDKIDNITFHMPHDYIPGTDIFIHMHWGQNGTAISGSLVVDYYLGYCKGHNQSSQIFAAPINVAQTVSTPDVATFPRWGHFINEIQVSNNGGDSTHLDTNALEPDGLVLMSFNLTTKPTITGSATSNLPYIFMIDIHYQSSNIGTKQKSPNFYT